LDLTCVRVEHTCSSISSLSLVSSVFYYTDFSILLSHRTIASRLTMKSVATLMAPHTTAGRRKRKRETTAGDGSLAGVGEGSTGSDLVSVLGVDGGAEAGAVVAPATTAGVSVDEDVALISAKGTSGETVEEAAESLLPASMQVH
jgi:hypothetical protein